jgi:hypothetical protein
LYQTTRRTVGGPCLGDALPILGRLLLRAAEGSI